MLFSAIVGLLLINSANALSVHRNDDGRPLFIVPLDKQYVPVMRGNMTVMHKTAYFGNIYVGAPEMQAFKVVFDTGSGHFFLPSESCTSSTCQKHKRYSRSRSSTAMEIDFEGKQIVTNGSASPDRDKVAIQFGTGEVEGEFVQELACLSNHTGDGNIAQNADCASVRMITATQMTNEPFQEFAFDGVVGLGLESLALHPGFSFFSQVSSLNRLPEQSFSVFVSNHDSIASEIAFGGHDERRMSHALRWAPVVKPELGYWQVHVKAITVGGETLPLCATGDCTAVLDTGTSLLGIPKEQLSHFQWLLARVVKQLSPNSDCRQAPGPNITFTLGDFNVTLGPEDYSRPRPLQINNTKLNKSQTVCRASLLPVDMAATMGSKMFILGEPVLRKYYTTYDWGRRKIGFALAVQPSEVVQASKAPWNHSILSSDSRREMAPTVVRI